MKLPRMIGTLGLASVLTIAAGLGILAQGTGSAQAQQGTSPMAGCPHAGRGYGMMGYGMMGRGMMGQGMGLGMMGGGMGPGMGQGMMGQGMMGQGMGQGYGPGPMGPGMGMGMGPGMMGQGMGPGVMQALPQDLTPEQLRHMFEHRLSWHNNPNIKVGDVIEADEDTITVEIVTQDGSLVRRFAVDRHTGMFSPAQ